MTEAIRSGTQLGVVHVVFGTGYELQVITLRDIFKRHEMQWVSEKTTIFSDYQNLGHHNFPPHYFSRIFFDYDIVDLLSI